MANQGLLYIILFCAFVLFALIHLFYYLFIFSRFAFHNKPDFQEDEKWKTGMNPPVSVIICAKNEAVNLRKNLPSFLDQSYPDFEVIVVNDASWDETGEVLKEIKPHYSRL